MIPSRQLALQTIQGPGQKNAVHACIHECIAGIVSETPAMAKLLSTDPEKLAAGFRDRCPGRTYGGADCLTATKCQRKCGSVANITDIVFQGRHYGLDEKDLEDLSVCEQFYSLWDNLCQLNPGTRGLNYLDKGDCSFMSDDKQWSGHKWC